MSVIVTNLMYSSRSLFSPVFFKVLFRTFQLVLETPNLYLPIRFQDWQ